MNGDAEVPFIRTGSDSIYLSGAMPEGELSIQKVVIPEKKKQQPKRLDAAYLSIINRSDVDRIVETQSAIEETQKGINEKIGVLDQKESSIQDLETQNAQDIESLGNKTAEVVSVLKKQIETSAKQNASVQKALSKMIGDSVEDLKDSLVVHETSNNPHRISKATIGLDKVENISPDDMPVSKATKKELEKKADKDELKTLKKEIEKSGKTQEKINKGLERLNYFGGVGGNELPIGGTAGQLLAKGSDQTGDYKWVDQENCKVKDVKVNGTSVVTDGVAVIPIAQQQGDYGLVKLASDSTGIMLSNTGTLQTRRATDADITARTQINRPIVPANLDLAVKTSVTDNTITLSSAEQTSACNWIGASQGVTKRVWYEE